MVALSQRESPTNIEWERTYGDGSDDEWSESAHLNSGFDWSFSVHQTADEGYVVSGVTSSFRVGSSADAWLFKLDSNGNIEWEKLIANYAPSFPTVRLTSDGGYVASTGALIVKLDSDANLEWEKNVWADHVMQTSDGGFIATGTTFRSESDGDSDVSLVKLDKDGNIEWQNGYDGVLDQFFRSVEQTADGGFIVSTSQADSAFSDAWILKVGSDGGIADCVNDIVYSTNNTLSNQESEFQDTTAEVTNSSAVVIPVDAEVNDIHFTIATQCSPSNNNNGEKHYSLSLFENGNVPIEGVTDLGSEVRALAETSDPEVFEVKFRWINPSGEVSRSFGTGSIDEPIVSEQDFFRPDEQGTWVIEADFGNGQIVRKTIETTFFVLPESPIGAIGLTIASLSALAIFSYLRMTRK
jgi:hypothetical protein